MDLPITKLYDGTITNLYNTRILLKCIHYQSLRKQYIIKMVAP